MKDCSISHLPGTYSVKCLIAWLKGILSQYDMLLFVVFACFEDILKPLSTTDKYLISGNLVGVDELKHGYILRNVRVM